MEFLKTIERKTLLITDTTLKTKILEEINSLDRLINVKIMPFEEFLKHYFFDYNKEAIYYITKKYQVTVKNAILYLENLKFVLDTNLQDEKIIFLKSMFEDLKKNHLLIFDPLFRESLNSMDIMVLNKEMYDPFYLQIFDTFHATTVELDKKTIINQPNLYHFKTIEEECAFVFDQISSLIKKGISFSKIKIIPLGSEYQAFLKRFSKLYHIKINNLEKNSIYGTLATNQFIHLIESHKSKTEIMEFIQPNFHQEIFQSFFAILNHYYFIDDLSLVIDLIKEELKMTYLKNPMYQEAIDVISFNSFLIEEDEFVFLMGFNLENIPKTYKDIDYLDDNLKQILGLFTSLEKNKLEHTNTLKHLKNINNLVITYKDTDPYNSYYPANLIEELEIKSQDIQTFNTTSNLYNKMKLTSQLDTMLKYGTKFQDTNILLNTYKDFPYLKYDNQFTGISNFYMDKIILSYTSINNYYHCAFRYYIENILKLNIYEETFKIYIGNLFHFILSKIFEEQFDFEKEFLNYTKEKEFTKKELFYLDLLKDELKTIISIINSQHQLSGLNKVKLETEICLNYQDKYIFKGIIDKMMYREKENMTYVSLIDYKTGIPKTDMSNLIYGIDMQLPIYAYLIKKSNLLLNPTIIGFYLQQIIHEKNSYDPKKTILEIKKDKLKLNGYTIDDINLVGMFDSSFENSEMIKSMKFSNQKFGYYTKVISEDAIDKLVDIVDLKIKTAFEKIENGEFPINPKIIGGENIGCSFCKYKDLCFKSGKDDVYLEKKSDLSYLEGDEENA